MTEISGGKKKKGFLCLETKKMVSACPCPLHERKSKCVDTVKKAEVFASFCGLILRKEG